MQTCGAMSLQPSWRSRRDRSDGEDGGSKGGDEVDIVIALAPLPQIWPKWPNQKWSDAVEIVQKPARPNFSDLTKISLHTATRPRAGHGRGTYTEVISQADCNVIQLIAAR